VPHHVLLRLAAHEEGAAQVHVHDGVPALDGHLEQQVVAQHARVVDEDQRRPEALGGPGYTLAHTRLVAHVDGEGLGCGLGREPGGA
jgi:hypothetical protein